MTVLRHEPGVRMSKACESYCHPRLLAERNDAYAVTGGNLRVVTHSSFMGGTPPSQQHRNSAIAKYEVAHTRCFADLRSKLSDERLVARGFHCPPSGRDPKEPRVQIPNDVLEATDLKLDWRSETISGNQISYASVWIAPRNEVPEFAAELVGCSLAECFDRIVIDDWVRRELEAYAFDKFREWKFDHRQTGSDTSDVWRVAFENWEDPAFLIISLLNPMLIREQQTPPEPVIAVRIRLEEQMRLLLSWLRAGHLVADGNCEPKNDDLTRKHLSADWWTQPDVEIDSKCSALFRWEDSKRVVKFSDIQIAECEFQRTPSEHRPAYPVETPTTPSNSEELVPAKNTIAGQRRCERWLSEYAVNLENGTTAHVPRDKLQSEAIEKFQISKKAFTRAWYNVTEKYPNLSKPGVRPRPSN